MQVQTAMKGFQTRTKPASKRIGKIFVGEEGGEVVGGAVLVEEQEGEEEDGEAKV